MDVGKETKSSQPKTEKKQKELKMGLTVAVKMLQSMILLHQRLIPYKYAWGSQNVYSKSDFQMNRWKTIYIIDFLTKKKIT